MLLKGYKLGFNSIIIYSRGMVSSGLGLNQ